MFDDSRTTLYIRFWRLAGINILSNLMVPLAGLVDVAFLGHLSEIRYLAGTALATVIFNALYWTCSFLRLGTTGPTSQADGRGDIPEMAFILLRNASIALALGSLFLLLQHPIRELGLSVLGSSSEIKPAAEAYFNARIWGAPAVLLNFVCLGWLLGREYNNRVLLLSILGNGVNIILDYWLIMRWDWASAGAGAATAVSQYAILFGALFFISRERWWSDFSLNLRQIFELSAMRSLLALNGNIWLRTSIETFTAVTLNEVGATFGTNILAINTLLYQVVMIVFYITEGLSFGTERLSGLFKGQGNVQDSKMLLQVASTTSFVLGVIIALPFITLPTPLFSILTNHPEIILGLKIYLPWLFPLLIAVSLAFMLDGYFLGLAEGGVLRNASLLGCIAGFIPATVIAYHIHNNHILWLGLSLFLILKAIFLGAQVPKTLVIPPESDVLQGNSEAEADLIPSINESL